MSRSFTTRPEIRGTFDAVYADSGSWPKAA